MDMSFSKCGPSIHSIGMKHVRNAESQASARIYTQISPEIYVLYIYIYIYILYAVSVIVPLITIFWGFLIWKLP